MYRSATKQLHLIVKLSYGSFKKCVYSVSPCPLSAVRTAPFKYTNGKTNNCGPHSVIEFHVENFCCISPASSKKKVNK
jgi:hypothetical protein